MKNPIDFFFSLGDKFATDIKRKADWDFYLLCIMFLAFLTILIDNLIAFFNTQRFTNLGWSFVMLAILYFQFFGLKQAYEFRKIIKKPKQEVKIESPDEMLKEFKLSKEDKEIFNNELKGGKNNEQIN